MHFLSKSVKEACALYCDVTTSYDEGLTWVFFKAKQVIRSDGKVSWNCGMLPRSTSNGNHEVLCFELVLGSFNFSRGKWVLIRELHSFIVSKGSFGIDVIDAELSHL